MTGLVYTAHKATDVLEEFLREIGIRTNFRIASNLMLTRETYIAVQDVQKKIKRIGLSKAFRLAGLQLLFSGPLRHIKNNFCKPLNKDDNTMRAKKYSHSTPHTLLDFTKVGKWNDKYKKYGVYSFIQKPFLGKRTNDSMSQTNFYMGAISAAMILATSGDVETFVCGAEWSSVFLTYELPALMMNKKIKNINGISAGEFRKAYYSKDPDAVYKTFCKICDSEIVLTQQRMERGNKHKRRLARKDYAAQTEFLKRAQEDRTIGLKRGEFVGALRRILVLKSTPVI